MLNQNLSIEEHDRSKDEQIFNLQQCVYPDHHLYKERELTRKYWSWRYYSHPTIKSKVFVIPAEESNVVAGMRPVTFLPIQSDGKEVLSAWLTAVVTHPRYRGMGIFSNLVRHSLKNAREAGARFAFTFPNDRSYAIYKKKVEWRYVGAIPLHVKILRPFAIIKMGIGMIPLLRRYIKQRSWDVRAVAGSSNVFSDGSKEFKINSADCIDSEYDQLWRRVSEKFKIVVNRDADYLRWRYLENPITEYTILEARRKGDNRLLGYLVTTIQVRGTKTLGLIVDLLVENENLDVCRVLVRSANAWFLKSGVAIAAALIKKCHAFAKGLQQCGYYLMPNSITPKKFHVIVSDLTNNKEFEDYISDFNNWYLTWGDTDNV